MAILLGIDGTGSKSDTVYREDFKNSFVNRIVRDSRIENQNKKYFRGPDIWGFGLKKAINSGFDFVFERHRQIASQPILLTGYSRGAAGVIIVAKKLQKENIRVAAMLLLDAVGRHIVFNASQIPNNVDRVLHLRRDAVIRSRRSFGSTGTKWLSPTVYEEKFFVSTHGGLGGKPWKLNENSPEDLVNEGFPDGKANITFARDTEGSEQIWNYMQPFIKENGFV